MIDGGTEERRVLIGDASNMFDGYITGDPGVTFPMVRGIYIEAERCARGMEERTGAIFTSGSRLLLTANRLTWLGVDSESLEIFDQDPPGRRMDFRKLIPTNKIPHFRNP